MAYPRSDHCNGARFFNPGGPQVKGFFDVLRWKLRNKPSPWVHVDVTQTVPPRFVDGRRCRITLVNHSTVLIQCAGINILTDPIWSDRASPFSWVGPRRKTPPGVRFEDLPAIDLVLLSHNHYDHFDLPTLRRIASQHKARFIVPLGVGQLLQRAGIRPEPEPESEMDWWQTAGAITCVPARHFSARTLADRNRTLWCGYWITTPAASVYFAGDTAFGAHFAEIKDRLGSPQVALLPIGAYKPEWFMQPVHMSPAQAVEAHRTLRAERSIAIHWGTFQLGDDADYEPADDLKRALGKGTPASPFEVIPNGGVVEFCRS